MKHQILMARFAFIQQTSFSIVTATRWLSKKPFEVGTMHGALNGRWAWLWAELCY